MSTDRRSRRTIHAAIVAVPLLAWLVAIPRLGRLHANDWWDVMSKLATGSQLRGDLAAWLAIRSNEHRIPLGALVYRLELWLGGGDNRHLSLWAVALMAVIASGLLALIPTGLAGWPRWLLAGGLVGLAFTPAAVHCVALGFSGTLWLGANAWALVAVIGLGQILDGRERATWWTALAGLAAAATYSSGLPLPILLAAAAIVGRASLASRLALATSAAAMLAVVVLGGQSSPGHHPTPTLDPGLVAHYLAAWLGSIASSAAAPAAAIGAVGLLAAGWAAVSLLRVDGPRRRRLLPIAVLLAYALGNGLATAVTRAGFGIEQATASRYATLSGLAWASLLLLLGSTGRPGRSWRPAVAAMAAMALAVAGAARGLPHLDAFVRRAAAEPMAETAIRLGVHDQAALRRVTPWPPSIWPVVPVLAARGAVPFDRAADPPVGTRLEVAERLPEGVAGALVHLAATADGAVEVGGWVRGAATAVAPVDPAGRVVGEAVLDLPSLLLHDRPADRGIGGYVVRHGAISLAVRIDDRWYRLPTARRVDPVEASR